MENLLYERIDYKIEETAWGTWRSFMGINGQLFREFVSHAGIWGLPILHYTYGRDPATGRRKIARGVFAIGRIAVGVVPIGQLAIGIMPIGQAALGLFFGIGQLATGLFAVGQFAISVFFALGQFAVGMIAIGQFAVGLYGIGQIAYATHAWTPAYKDPAIQQMIRTWLHR